MASTGIPNADTFDWPDEGDPPTPAEDELAERVDFICDELDRAATYPDEAAYYLSGALDSARNHGTGPLSERQRDALFRAIALARPTVVAALPKFSRPRILDALDALAELAAWCSGCDFFAGIDDASYAERCRRRMRVGQNENHNLSLLGDMTAGKLPATLQRLQRIARNEVENLALGADEPGRRQPGRPVAA